MRWTWRLGKVGGIPIFLHWTVFIALAWFYYRTRSVGDTAISFVGLFGLLLAHELGHAAVARWRRVEVGWIQLYFLHGVCAHEHPDTEEDDVFIAWGGVAAQLAVLIAAFGVDLVLAAVSPAGHAAAVPLLRVLIDVNLFIMIVNLIPVPPLDGAKAWRALPLLRDWARETPLADKLRMLSAARGRAREKKIAAKSERITAEIIDKLKKGKRDA
jgi:stage IV sporulation protein FB